MSSYMFNSWQLYQIYTRQDPFAWSATSIAAPHIAATINLVSYDTTYPYPIMFFCIDGAYGDSCIPHRPTSSIPDSNTFIQYHYEILQGYHSFSCDWYLSDILQMTIPSISSPILTNYCSQVISTRVVDTCSSSTCNTPVQTSNSICSCENSCPITSKQQQDNVDYTIECCNSICVSCPSNDNCFNAPSASATPTPTPPPVRQVDGKTCLTAIDITADIATGNTGQTHSTLSNPNYAGEIFICSGAQIVQSPAIWYYAEITRSGRYFMDTCGSDYPTQISVFSQQDSYNSETCRDLKCLISRAEPDFDTCSPGLPGPTVLLYLEEGTRIFIVVNGAIPQTTGTIILGVLFLGEEKPTSCNFRCGDQSIVDGVCTCDNGSLHKDKHCTDICTYCNAPIYNIECFFNTQIKPTRSCTADDCGKPATDEMCGCEAFCTGPQCCDNRCDMCDTQEDCAHPEYGSCMGKCGATVGNQQTCACTESCYGSACCSDIKEAGCPNTYIDKYFERTDTCVGRCGQPIGSPNSQAICSCEPNCVFTGKCCTDYCFSCNSTNACYINLNRPLSVPPVPKTLQKYHGLSLIGYCKNPQNTITSWSCKLCNYYPGFQVVHQISVSDGIDVYVMWNAIVKETLLIIDTATYPDFVGIVGMCLNANNPFGDIPKQTIYYTENTNDLCVGRLGRVPFILTYLREVGDPGQEIIDNLFNPSSLFNFDRYLSQVGASTLSIIGNGLGGSIAHYIYNYMAFDKNRDQYLSKFPSECPPWPYTYYKLTTETTTENDILVQSVSTTSILSYNIIDQSTYIQVLGPDYDGKNILNDQYRSYTYTNVDSYYSRYAGTFYSYQNEGVNIQSYYLYPSGGFNFYYCDYKLNTYCYVTDLNTVITEEMLVVGIVASSIGGFASYAKNKIPDRAYLLAAGTIGALLESAEIILSIKREDFTQTATLNFAANFIGEYLNTYRRPEVDTRLFNTGVSDTCGSNNIAELDMDRYLQKIMNNTITEDELALLYKTYPGALSHLHVQHSVNLISAMDSILEHHEEFSNNPHVVTDPTLYRTSYESLKSTVDNLLEEDSRTKTPIYYVAADEDYPYGNYSYIAKMSDLSYYTFIGADTYCTISLLAYESQLYIQNLKASQEVLIREFNYAHLQKYSELLYLSYAPFDQVNTNSFDCVTCSALGALGYTVVAKEIIPVYHAGSIVTTISYLGIYNNYTNEFIHIGSSPKSLQQVNYYSCALFADSVPVSLRASNSSCLGTTTLSGLNLQTWYPFGFIELDYQDSVFRNLIYQYILQYNTSVHTLLTNGVMTNEWIPYFTETFANPPLTTRCPKDYLQMVNIQPPNTIKFRTPNPETNSFRNITDRIFTVINRCDSTLTRSIYSYSPPDDGNYNLLHAYTVINGSVVRLTQENHQCPSEYSIVDNHYIVGNIYSPYGYEFDAAELNSVRVPVQQNVANTTSAVCSYTPSYVYVNTTSDPLDENFVITQVMESKYMAFIGLAYGSTLNEINTTPPPLEYQLYTNGYTAIDKVYLENLAITAFLQDSLEEIIFAFIPRNDTGLLFRDFCYVDFLSHSKSYDNRCDSTTPLGPIQVVDYSSFSPYDWNTARTFINSTLLSLLPLDPYIRYTGFGYASGFGQALLLDYYYPRLGPTPCLTFLNMPKVSSMWFSSTPFYLLTDPRQSARAFEVASLFRTVFRYNDMMLTMINEDIDYFTTFFSPVYISGNVANSLSIYEVNPINVFPEVTAWNIFYYELYYNFNPIFPQYSNWILRNFVAEFGNPTLFQFVDYIRANTEDTMCIILANASDEFPRDYLTSTSSIPTYELYYNMIMDSYCINTCITEPINRRYYPPIAQFTNGETVVKIFYKYENFEYVVTMAIDSTPNDVAEKWCPTPYSEMSNIANWYVYCPESSYGTVQVDRYINDVYDRFNNYFSSITQKDFMVYLDDLSNYGRGLVTVTGHGLGGSLAHYVNYKMILYQVRSGYAFQCKGTIIPGFQYLTLGSYPMVVNNYTSPVSSVASDKVWFLVKGNDPAPLMPFGGYGATNFLRSPLGATYFVFTDGTKSLVTGQTTPWFGTSTSVYAIKHYLDYSSQNLQQEYNMGNYTASSQTDVTVKSNPYNNILFPSYLTGLWCSYFAAYNYTM